MARKFFMHSMLLFVFYSLVAHATNIQLYNSLETSIYYCVNSTYMTVTHEAFNELATGATVTTQLNDNKECTVGLSLQAPAKGNIIALFTITIDSAIATIALKTHIAKAGTLGIIPHRQSIIPTDTPQVSHKDIWVKYEPYHGPVVKPAPEVTEQRPEPVAQEPIQVTSTLPEQSSPSIEPATAQSPQEQLSPNEAQSTSEQIASASDSTGTSA